ncbi:MAG: 16S rRNA (adenine(1518)-N(6)/adenine(1519)-N(6))-dimethyltransferase RsmA [Armatimonadetes bacterium]|nr:16S rRNA (adenine(1518)-N(6)/adenine(1519)-N(6))-dimethyltransferase RsmA [Armatimonadota bacterium]
MSKSDFSSTPPKPRSPSPNLSSRSQVIGLLKKHGLFLKKSLGQNFLVEPNALQKIVEAVDPQPEEGILEIGPGIGTLTRALAERAGAVAAVEFDPRFLPALEESLADAPPVRIVQGDVLKVNLRQLLLDFGDRPKKAAANLPYYITTPALTRLLEQHDLLQRIVVLVQKEVADRMKAQPGTPDYGSFSVFVQYYAEVSVTAIVPGSAFLPPPKVSSAVVRLDLRPAPPVEVPDEERFFKVVRAAFGQRRKTLANALSGGLKMSRGDVEAIIREAGLDPQIRGEKLGLEAFAALARAFPSETTVSES